MKPEDEIDSEFNYEEEAASDDVDALDEGELNPAASPHKKVVLDKADRSLSELHRWYKSGRIIIDPEWQRNYVWDPSRASKLIESFLLDIPIEEAWSDPRAEEPPVAREKGVKPFEHRVCAARLDGRSRPEAQGEPGPLNTS